MDIFFSLLFWQFLWGSRFAGHLLIILQMLDILEPKSFRNFVEHVIWRIWNTTLHIFSNVFELSKFLLNFVNGLLHFELKFWKLVKYTLSLILVHLHQYLAQVRNILHRLHHFFALIAFLNQILRQILIMRQKVVIRIRISLFFDQLLLLQSVQFNVLV